MPSAGTIAVSIVGDSRDLTRATGQAERAMSDMGDTAHREGSRVDAAFESTAGHADDVASKGAQAAGALSGLGDLVGGSFGSAMVVGGTAMQAFADAGDLVNVVTESSIVLKAKDVIAAGAQKAATIASTVATNAQAIAQRALNLAMEANPVLLVVAGILALAAAAVVAYKKSETFRKIVKAAFEAVEKAAKSVANFFTKTLPKMFDKVKDAATAARKWITGRFQDTIDWFQGIPGRVSRAAGDVFGAIRDKAGAAVTWVRDHFGSKGLVGWFTGLPGKVKTALTSLPDKMKSVFRSAFNAIIGLWNSIDFGINFDISIPSWVPGVGGKGFGIHIDDLFPDITPLATGGLVTRPTLALVGEAEPEAVIPLSRAGTLGGNTYHVYVNVAPGGDLVEAGRQMIRAIDAYERAGGRRRG